MSFDDMLFLILFLAAIAGGILIPLAIDQQGPVPPAVRR